MADWGTVVRLETLSHHKTVSDLSCQSFALPLFSCLFGFAPSFPPVSALCSPNPIEFFCLGLILLTGMFTALFPLPSLFSPPAILLFALLLQPPVYVCKLIFFKFHVMALYYCLLSENAAASN